ncbi:MAG TPA: efflux RND transporter periplasmic adaptor subunit [Rhodospirillaceae bacterium]|nr:efflux transporter periplasmic adaptor subunit [Magnetovibrio sp.]HCS71926.1 efflux RND transporter periplasmic adaptor subunit [Rhodospirillaceae bacterium]
MKTFSSRRVALGVLLIAVGTGAYFMLAGGPAADKPAAKAGGKPATPVVVTQVTTRTMPVTIRAIGTIQALATVSVRSRVDGQIMETAFTEGQTVAKGDPLFHIDPRPFQARLREAEANLARDRANLEKAQGDFQRYQSLSGKGFSSQQKFEEARAAVNSLSATIRAGQAAVDLAKLNLEFTTIRAPLDGRTGSVLVQAGNLVKADDQQALVVINQVNPILAALSVPEGHLAEIKRRLAEGSLAVEAAVPDSNRPPNRGRVVFINNAVDTQTGTILLKAEFDNTDGFLTPGQFVRVVIEMDSIANTAVVPERAVQSGQKGNYVFVVNPADMTVQPRPVVLGPSIDDFVAIGDALKPGDTVVTDGQLRLFKGAKVTFKSDGAKKAKGEKKTGDAAPAAAGAAGKAGG